MFVAADRMSVALTLLFTGASALWDLKTGLIPNRLLLWSLSLLVLTKLVVGGMAEELSLASVLGTSLAGATVCAAVPALLYVSRGLGGGDLKLLTLVGAALGPMMGVEVEMYAFCLGALFALSYLAYHGLLFRSLFAAAGGLFCGVRRVRQKPALVAPEALKFRFGPAIFAGALLTLARALALS
jgi:Flp pilus assembly protein protease CpaA